jgi:hypothetical protein
MSEKVIRIDFNYTEQEYIAGNRLFLLGSPRILTRVLVVSALLALVISMASLLWADVPLWAAAAWVALVEAALFYSMLVNAPRRYFRGDRRLHDRHEMFFTEEGITVKSRQAEVRLAWSLYTRVIEGEQFFCLVYGEGIRTGTIIPKRAFRDRQDENAFRELLSRHLPKGLKARHADAGRLQESEYVPTDAGPPDWR